MKVKDLLTEQNWIKGAEARTSYWEETQPRSQDAVCWCLYGAIVYCYPPSEISAVLSKVFVTLDYKSIQKWNDNKSRKFAEVKQLVEELDI